MKNPRKNILGSALLVVGMLGSLHAAEAPEEAAAASRRLVKAVEENSFNDFVKDGEPAFKQLDRKQFEAVAKLFDERMKGGYVVDYLGDMKQQGYHVTLWRFRFKDGGDDALATLSMKDGKVGGYWIK
jgi:hypothetical protein